MDCINRLVYVHKSDNAAPCLDTWCETMECIAEFPPEMVKDGDMILFEGGYTYPAFELDGKKNITIGSYGVPAVIDGGAGHGLVLSDCENVHVFGLKVKGIGWRKSCQGIGVHIKNSSFVTVRNVEICGFRNTGLEIFSSDDVLVEGCFAHNNGFCGFNNYIGENFSNRVTIRHCKAFDNAGDPDIKDNHSGSGFAFFHVKDAVLEYCEAAGNGWAQRQKNINGPVGVWCACDCTDIVFRKSISHHNCTQPGGVDGDGFDIDGAVVNGYMEYNYSYQNEGSGYLFCEYGSGLDWKNNNMRYCISLNDGGRVVQQGAVQFFGPDWLTLDGSYTQNSLFAPAPGRHCIVNKEVGKDCRDLLVEKNVFVEGTAAAVSNPENPYVTVRDNAVIQNEELYRQTILQTPRLTNPRSLDKLPVFSHLEDGSVHHALESKPLDQLFGINAPFAVNDPGAVLEFTYFLNGRDFEGSEYSGDLRLSYDHVDSKMALEMKRGSDIRFQYPAWDSGKQHVAVLTARLQSPDVEAYFYIAEDDTIVKAVPIAGNVSDYNPICLTFDGFEGTPYLGIMVRGGEGSVFLENVQVYKLKESTVVYPVYPHAKQDKIRAYRSVGDVYDDGKAVALNGNGSAVIQSKMLLDDNRFVSLKIEANGCGGVFFAECEGKREEVCIQPGVQTYTLTLPDSGAAFCTYGVWNGIPKQEGEIRVYCK